MSNDEAGFLSAAVAQCAAHDDFAAVEGFISTYRDELTPGVGELVAALLERARQLGPPNNVPALLPLLTVSDSMSDDERDRLRGLILQALVSSAPSSSVEQLQPVLERASKLVSFESDYGLLVKEVWDVVKGQADPQQTLLGLVVANFNHLDPDRRAAFVTQFGNWVTQSSALRQPLTHLAAGIGDLKPTERKQLVEKIIEAERLESEPNIREPLFRAAQAIADAPRATAARKRLQERIDALEHGSDSDQVVWRRLTEQ
jgi:hypothetical protein